VRRQTYGYLPSRRASPPLDLYQIVLLGDRGTRVQEAQLSPSDRAMRLVSSNLRNSAETTYTTSPDQTDGMELEV